MRWSDMLVGEEGKRWAEVRCQAMKKTQQKSGKGDASDRYVSLTSCWI